MSYVPCPQGRLEALAMASMAMRAVIGPNELRFLAVPAMRVNFGPIGSTVPARLRPRDEGGRFVRYVWLTDAINFDTGVTDMEFENKPGAVVDAGSAIAVDDLFPYLTDELADELADEHRAEHGGIGADGPHTDGSVGLDGAVWPAAEGPSGDVRHPLDD